MRRRGAGGVGGVGAEIAVGSAVHLHRLVGPLEEHGVRLVLVPLQATALAVDADVEVVFLANGNLRAVQHALGAAGEPQQNVAVVIQLAAADECGEVGGQFPDF